MRPGINTTVLTQTPPTSPPISTGTWFVVGVCAQGPTAPQLIASFQQYQQVYGPRGTTSALLSDAVETFFKEGGSLLWVARVVGPAAVSASIALLDIVPAASCTVTAIGPGTYANGYKVVIAGSAGSYTATIEDSGSNVLEVSNTLTSLADFVAYGTTSQYVKVTATGTASPAAGTFTLASGADDISSITTAQYTAALALFTYDKGPGQVSAPGVTTTAVLTALANHAAASNRVVYGDLPDSNVAATLIGDAAPVTALGTPARVTALFTPWIDVAPVTGTVGLRAVPPSAFAAAKAAVVDALGNPNQAAAGINGVLSTALSLHATFTDSDRQLLNSAGINVIKPLAGGFRIYGARTATNPTTDPLYVWLPNVRLDMAIIAQANAIQENYEFSQLDGQGLDAARYGNDLNVMMNNWYTLPGGGAIFGATSTDAFTVDTSSDINTPTTEALNELLATIAYRRSPGAEQVNLNIVRVPITQAV